MSHASLPGHLFKVQCSSAPCEVSNRNSSFETRSCLPKLLWSIGIFSLMSSAPWFRNKQTSPNCTCSLSLSLLHVCFFAVRPSPLTWLPRHFHNLSSVALVVLEVVLVLPGLLIHVRPPRPSLPFYPRGVALFVGTVVLRTREISIVDICWSHFSQYTRSLEPQTHLQLLLSLP